MNITDPIVPAPKSAIQKANMTSLARKMMTASQNPAQHDSHHEQEGMSADSKPDMFTSQSHRLIQAHMHAAAAAIILPQDHYSWSHIPQESSVPVSNFHLIYTMLYMPPL